jgi:hypothetical protein
MTIVMAMDGAVILAGTVLVPWIVILSREAALIRDHKRRVAARQAAAAAASGPGVEPGRMNC